MHAMHQAAIEDLRRCTPQELEAAIALHSAHLRAAGYTFTFGKDN
jgi:hypothetical protein